jgi:hypothetical protein
MRWYRMCVDLDDEGRVYGCSYEVHDHLLGVLEFTVLDHGPFDTTSDALQVVEADIRRRFGHQQRLCFTD